MLTRDLAHISHYQGIDGFAYIICVPRIDHVLSNTTLQADLIETGSSNLQPTRVTISITQVSSLMQYMRHY